MTSHQEQFDAPERSGRAQRMEAHRGAAILVLGILGLVVCFILGIFAWTMGNEDLAKMRAGRMDPSGKGLTDAGRICGMVSVILAVFGLVIALAVFLAGGM